MSIQSSLALRLHRCLIGFILVLGTLQAGTPTLAVWSYLNLPDSPVDQARLFAFARRNGIGEIYLGGDDLLSGDPLPLAAFLGEAGARGLKVSLVMGDNAWIQPGQRAQALAQVKAVVLFARAQRKQGGFPLAGLHLDIEPYTLPQWRENWAALGSALLDLLEAVKAELGGELELWVDIPVWWDQLELERQGRTRPLCAWVMELAEHTVLMDYRNTPEAILRSAAPNLRLAAGQGRKLILGLDVHCDADPETPQTSFCGRGEQEFRKAMEEVARRLRHRPGYGGLAIFTFEDWRELH